MLHWQHAKRWLLVVVTVSYIAGTPQTMRTIAILLVAAVGCHGFNFLSKPKPAASTKAKAPAKKAVAASTKGIKKVVAPPKGKKAAPAPAAKKPAFANPFAAKSKAAPGNGDAQTTRQARCGDHLVRVAPAEPTHGRNLGGDA